MKFSSMYASYAEHQHFIMRYYLYTFLFAKWPQSTAKMCQFLLLMKLNGGTSFALKCSPAKCG